MKEYELKKKLCNSEQSDFDSNVICKTKLIQILCKENTDLPVQSGTKYKIEYKFIQGHLTLSVLEKQTCHLYSIVSSKPSFDQNHQNQLDTETLAMVAYLGVRIC